MTINRCPKCKNIQIVDEDTMIKCQSCEYRFPKDEALLSSDNDKFIIENHTLISLKINDEESEILLPDTVYYLKDKVDFQNISVIYISSNVREISDYFFEGNDKLKLINFSINTSITKIPKGLFKDCHNLEEVVLSQMISSIGEEAFQNDIKLHSINLNDNIIEIDSHAFENCKGLKEIILPTALTTINDYTFNNTAFENIYIHPNSLLKNIGNYAFANNNELVSFVVPKNIEYISLTAFDNANNIVLDIQNKNTIPIINKDGLLDKTKHIVKKELPKLKFKDTELYKYIRDSWIFSAIPIVIYIYLNINKNQFSREGLLLTSVIPTLLDIALYVVFIYRKDYPRKFFYFGLIPIYIILTVMIISFM